MIENGVMPEQILLLTFTNKAAHEMKSAYKEIFGTDLNKTSSIKAEYIVHQH